MQNKKILFVLFFSLHVFLLYSHNNTIIDSVKIELYHYADKEYIMPLLVGDDVVDEYILIGDATLSKKETTKLNKFIVSKKSFCNTFALLNHVDIEFKYYMNNIVVQRIMISSFTRNYILFNEKDEIVIRNRINLQFHHFVAKLLKYYGLWNDELEFNFYENYLENC